MVDLGLAMKDCVYNEKKTYIFFGAPSYRDMKITMIIEFFLSKFYPKYPELTSLISHNKD